MDFEEDAKGNSNLAKSLDRDCCCEDGFVLVRVEDDAVVKEDVDEVTDGLDARRWRGGWIAEEEDTADDLIVLEEEDEEAEEAVTSGDDGKNWDRDEEEQVDPVIVGVSLSFPPSRNNNDASCSFLFSRSLATNLALNLAYLAYFPSRPIHSFEESGRTKLNPDWFKNSNRVLDEEAWEPDEVDGKSKGVLWWDE